MSEQQQKEQASVSCSRLRGLESVSKAEIDLLKDERWEMHYVEEADRLSRLEAENARLREEVEKWRRNEIEIEECAEALVHREVERQMLNRTEAAESKLSALIAAVRETVKGLREFRERVGRVDGAPHGHALSILSMSLGQIEASKAALQQAIGDTQ